MLLASDQDVDNGIPLDFYVLTDRGSNADGPNIKVGSSTYGTKVFPAPAFAPTFGVLRLANGVATVTSITPMLNEKGTKLSGLPLPVGTPGLVGRSGPERGAAGPGR